MSFTTLIERCDAIDLLPRDEAAKARGVLTRDAELWAAVIPEAIRDPMEWLAICQVYASAMGGELKKAINARIADAKREAERAERIAVEQAAAPPEPPPPAGEDDEDGPDFRPPTAEAPKFYPMTDLGNAMRFVDLYGTDFRWCGSMPGTGWMVWDGSRWTSDDTRMVQRRAAALGDLWRAEANEAEDPAIERAIRAHVKRTESASGIRGTVEIAQAHGQIVTRPGQWDADLWAFNTPSVTYDLQKMTAHRPRRADYITRIGNVDAAKVDDCPVWIGFLDTIFGGDEELIGYIRRAMGYCLTGSTAEQCVFICYGTGQNGKSKFIEVLHHILGDYAKQTPVQTFTQKREGGIPNDLAALNGARVVTCSEAKEGEGLDEALVKLASGGDHISARFLNREFFSFLPAFKLWMLTNHKPIIRGTDKGIWRRIRLIPFLVTIPEDKVDKDIGTKLKAEACGILRWALRGLKDYHAVGLAPPAAVTAATDEYREDMDSLAEFIEDCIERDSTAEADNQDVYEAYKAWATSHGERNPRSHRSLSRELKARRFKQKADRSEGRRWEGMRLKERPQANRNGSGYPQNERQGSWYGHD